LEKRDPPGKKKAENILVPEAPQDRSQFLEKRLPFADFSGSGRACRFHVREA
jgi:hypothetical protein